MVAGVSDFAEITEMALFASKFFLAKFEFFTMSTLQVEMMILDFQISSHARLGVAGVEVDGCYAARRKNRLGYGEKFTDLFLFCKRALALHREKLFSYKFAKKKVKKNIFMILNDIFQTCLRFPRLLHGDGSTVRKMKA